MATKTYRVKLSYVVYTDVTIPDEPYDDVMDERFWEKATEQGYNELMNGEYEVEYIEKKEIAP